MGQIVSGTVADGDSQVFYAKVEDEAGRTMMESANARLFKGYQAVYKEFRPWLISSLIATLSRL